MSNFCSSCGKPIDGKMSFCPNCGHKTNGDAKQSSFSFNLSGATLEISSVDRPQGLDWVAVGLAAISCLYMLAFSWALSFIWGILFTGFLIYKRDVIKNALWHSNIFKPFIIHFAWGAFLVAIFVKLLEDAARSGMGGFIWLILPILLLLGNGIYYLGYRIICYFFKESKPQGQLVRMLVSMGLLLAYIAIKRDAKALDSLLGSDDVVTTGGAVDMANASDISDTSFTSPVSDASTNGDFVSVTDSHQASAVDISNATVSADTLSSVDTTNAAFTDTGNMNQDIATTAAAAQSPSDTTLNFTDSMSQSAGSATIHGDGSIDTYAPGMEHTGHITQSGIIFDNMNALGGQVIGNNIVDADGHLMYTIDGDVIYDKDHQVAYMIRDGHIFDKLNQLVGSFTKR